MLFFNGGCADAALKQSVKVESWKHYAATALHPLENSIAGPDLLLVRTFLKEPSTPTVIYMKCKLNNSHHITPRLHTVMHYACTAVRSIMLLLRESGVARPRGLHALHCSFY